MATKADSFVAEKAKTLGLVDEIFGSIEETFNHITSRGNSVASLYSSAPLAAQEHDVQR